MFRCTMLRSAAPALLLITIRGAAAQQTDDAAVERAVISANDVTALSVDVADDAAPQTGEDVDGAETPSVAFGHADQPSNSAATEDTDKSPAPTATGSAGEMGVARPMEPDRAADASDKPQPVEVAPQESRGLGAPNSLFNARPVTMDPAELADTDESAVPSFVRSLDPRDNSITRVIVSLGLVLLLLLLFKAVMKRGAGLLGQGARPSGVIEILARFPLGRKQSLVLLKVARRVLLLHQNGSDMTTLSEMTEPTEVAGLLARIEAGTSGKNAQRFRSILKHFEAEHEAAARRGERDDLFATVHGNGNGNSDRGELIDLTRGTRMAGRLGKRRQSA